MKAGDTFVAEDMCTPVCHELWNTVCPSVYALQNGGTPDHGEKRAKCFEAFWPDECRVRIRGEAVGTDGQNAEQL